MAKRPKPKTVYLDCNNMETLEEFQEKVGKAYSKANNLSPIVCGKFHHLTYDAQNTINLDLADLLEDWILSPPYVTSNEPLYPEQVKGGKAQ